MLPNFALIAIASSPRFKDGMYEEGGLRVQAIANRDDVCDQQLLIQPLIFEYSAQAISWSHFF